MPGTIDLITPPTGGSPITTDDYNAQNVLIQQLLFQYNIKQLFLTEWDNIIKPKIKQGVSIHHGGAQFAVNSDDVDISGSPTDGRVYVKLTRVGDQLQASFVNSAAGFSWNYTYNGFYNVGGNQLLPYVVILTDSGTEWNKHNLDNSENKYNIEAKIKVNFNINMEGWDIPGDLNRGFSLPIQFLTIYSALTIYDITNFITSVKIHIISDDQLISYNWNGVSSDVDLIYLIRQIQQDIYLSAIPGGLFDGGSFDDDTISRGNIHLECLL